MDQQQHEENVFLCGSQKIRRYGSLSDSKFCHPKHKRIIIHKVMPTDTLQGLELCYKSSMYEIKRLNKLWSDQSLYCKNEVLIPIFDEETLITQPSNERSDYIESSRNANGASECFTEETVDQLFRRIDLGVKQTKNTVKKLMTKRVQTFTEE